MTTMQIAGTESSETITATELSQKSVTSSTTDSYPVQKWLGSQLIDDGKAVEYEGDKPVINPSVMTEGQPYPVLLYGEKVWVVKEANGEVSFYHLGEQR